MTGIPPFAAAAVIVHTTYAQVVVSALRIAQVADEMVGGGDEQLLVRLVQLQTALQHAVNVYLAVFTAVGMELERTTGGS